MEMPRHTLSHQITTPTAVTNTTRKNTRNHQNGWWRSTPEPHPDRGRHNKCCSDKQGTQQSTSAGHQHSHQWIIRLLTQISAPHQIPQRKNLVASAGNSFRTTSTRSGINDFQRNKNCFFHPHTRFYKRTKSDIRKTCSITTTVWKRNPPSLSTIRGRKTLL